MARQGLQGRRPKRRRGLTRHIGEDVPADALARDGPGCSRGRRSGAAHPRVVVGDPTLRCRRLQGAAQFPIPLLMAPLREASG